MQEPSCHIIRGGNERWRVRRGAWLLGLPRLLAQTRRARQGHREPRPAAFLACDLDAALVQIHGGLDQIKADAGADDAGDVAAAIVALEQPAEVGGRNTDTT